MPCVRANSLVISMVELSRDSDAITFKVYFITDHGIDLQASACLKLMGLDSYESICCFFWVFIST